MRSVAGTWSSAGREAPRAVRRPGVGRLLLGLLFAASFVTAGEAKADEAPVPTQVQDPTPEGPRLVSGAPLGDPNVAVHTVEARPFPDAGRAELVLYPLAMQLNGKFTQHFGTMGAALWHVREHFALMLTGGGNWSALESSFNQTLAERASVQAQAASSLLWTWGLAGGVEVTPVYGKFALFEDTLVHFALVLSGAAGAGGTRHQLTPATGSAAASFGDTGVRFLGSLGAGFRVRLGRSLALRLEVRDVVYTARVAAVNGCGEGDLAALLDAGDRLGSVAVSSSCRTQPFQTAAGRPRSTDLNLALDLVRGDRGVPSSDVLNNVGLYLGLALVL